MDYSHFHERAVQKLNEDFEETTPPLTPTKSEFDTFQVLSNSNLVDFNKEKFSSKVFSPITSPPKKEEETPEYFKEKEEENYNKLNDFQNEGENGENQNEEDEDKDYFEEINPPSLTRVPFFEQPPTYVNNVNTKQNGKQNVTYAHPLNPEMFSENLNDLKDVKDLKKHSLEEMSIASKNSEIEEEIEFEKEALLEELQSLQRNGVYTPIKVLTLKNSLEEIQFQYDKVQNELNTSQGVAMAVTGIKMGSSLIETVLKRFGFSSVDGFSHNLCKDPEKFNRPVTKLYKKYWRKGSTSPEVELSMIVLGSLAWTIVQNKMNPAPAPAPKVIAPEKQTFEKQVPDMQRRGNESKPRGMQPGNYEMNETRDKQERHFTQENVENVTEFSKVDPLPMFPSSKENGNVIENQTAVPRPPPPRVNLQQLSKTLPEKSLPEKSESSKKISLGSRNSSLQSNASLNKKKQPMIRL